MSNYQEYAINPTTGEVELAWFLDGHFGKHRYGIRFANDSHVDPAEQVKLPDSKEEQ